MQQTSQQTPPPPSTLSPPPPPTLTPAPIKSRPLRSISSRRTTHLLGTAVPRTYFRTKRDCYSSSPNSKTLFPSRRTLARCTRLRSPPLMVPTSLSCDAPLRLKAAVYARTLTCLSPICPLGLVSTIKQHKTRKIDPCVLELLIKSRGINKINKKNTSVCFFFLSV